MKKIIALCAVCCLIVNCLFSQDILVLKNGDEIQSKIIEINPLEIKYKKFDNPDGPIILVNKTDVFMIKYQNGTKDLINNNLSKENESKSEKNKSSLNPNRIGLYVNPLGFLQFGPIVGTEITLKSSIIIDAHFRLPSLGLLMYQIESEDGESPSLSGLALGGGLKYLNPTSSGGIYFGGIFEYGGHTASYGSNYSEVEYIVTMANIGYKFHSKSGLYLNTGLFFGSSHTFEDIEYNGNGTNDNGTDTRVIGMLELSLGYDF
jgi:hypothetical protein